MVNITLSESILGSLDREDNHGGWEFVFSAPFKFGILIILIAVRIKRYFWRPKRRLVDADWICLTKPTLFDKAQGFTASLLLVHAVAGLTGLSPNSSQDQVLNLALEVLVWIGCLAVMVFETHILLGRSPELKIFWLIDFLVKTFHLRGAFLDFATGQPNSATLLLWSTIATFLSAIIAAQGLFQPASLSKEVYEQTYGRMFDEGISHEKRKAAQSMSSWASIATFSWITRTLKVAQNGKIDEEQLRSMQPEDRCSVKRAQLLNAWNTETQHRPANPKLWRALASVFSFDFLLAASFNLISIALDVIQPLLLQTLIQSIEESVEEESEDFRIVRLDALMIAVAIAVCNIANMLLREQWVTRFCTTNVQIRGALTGMIFRKAFVLSAQGRQGYKIGELISLMSVDANRLGHSMHGLHMLWSAPLTFVAGTVLLVQMLGTSVFVGLLVPVVLLPVNQVLIRCSAKMNKDLMKVKDERSNLMDEVVQGIRIIKYFSWEKNFEQKVQRLRGREISLIRKIGICNALIQSISSAMTMLIALVTFTVYAINGEELKPSIAFGGLALFGLIEHPTNMLGHLVHMIIESSIALGRLRDYFQAEELDPGFYSNSDQDHFVGEDSMMLSRKEKAGKAIQITDCSCSWPTQMDHDSDSSSLREVDGKAISRKLFYTSICSMFESKPEKTLLDANTNADPVMVLKNINLEIPHGQLCMITGPVGCGKTSLLSAMLGEIQKESGEVVLSGKVAYAPQQPWIFNASVQENILFGADYDAERYNLVLRVCALEHDLKILPAGDQTEIGEKGVNLSGGQKARICLARAVYQKADVYLFDDPLSAVDVHVSQTMFYDCICTFLSGKTRVLVSHQVQYIGGADMIVHVENGSIIAQGTPKEVMVRCPELEVNIHGVGEDDDKDDKGPHDKGPPSPRRKSDDSESSADTLNGRKGSVDIHASEGGEKQQRLKKRKDSSNSKDFAAAQTAEEEMLEGAVDVKIWKQYIQVLGTWSISVFMLVKILHIIFSLATNWWVSVWSTASTSQSDSNASHSSQPIMYYIVTMAMIDVAKNALSTILLLLQVFTGLSASTMLHNGLVTAVLRAPMEFFDTTPSGRILNRFTSNVNELDRDVANRLASFIGNLLEVVLLIGVISFVEPMILVIAPVSMFLLFKIQILFKRGCLQLQRLESITKSPLFAHFSESLNGVSTIRAFGMQEEALKTACQRHDRYAQAWMNLIDCHQWLSVRIVSLAALIILATSAMAVLAASPTAASAATTGLIITYAIKLNGLLQETIRSFTHSEQGLVAVERVTEYGAIEGEDTCSTPVDPPKEWPFKGKLEFDKVVMSYRKDLPPALKGLSFSTQPGEKIGVVGRTGAGKSSLAVALFRLAHNTAGTVTLDGVDVSTIRLEELRRKLSIIPQDPVLFSGTIRSNLDPFDEYTDEAVWTALESVHMRDLVNGYLDGLGQPVEQGGANLSIGQRQLFCLARALLRKAKVIIMDEATANVDLQTDRLIQDAVRSHFQESTVLTIAHRLNTVMCSDRVMLLGDGRVLEVGAPLELAADPSSQFHAMVSNPAAEKEMLG